ncbi:TauD/TfdA family dioxygenase (plasmid) [Streptomyces sp. BB1-1-1]|uniref:TauD/TfdA family dioxygenase n=1 Tax=Streptomyces sp. BB1-1-1 TaxID=3074430 RepID=UPI002877BD28|nr:TauD/TfdA family dioxygenase [Streptomyces sp. BB1-1-1]WND32863.1 TauD/TfdA family dioxygenase [Streptomyces sp. BB1-1-1]WND40068.1 TauD/TfdA family dioxygenase [Streptomyces sp. BB1-1-1]WND40903.1 TauD/TfdA family dioxygenase [Streptomyces sp. BB1-1-1]
MTNRISVDQSGNLFPELLPPFTLDGQERSALTADCRKIAEGTPFTDLDSNAALSSMVSGARHLPARLVEELTHFRWTSNDHGALVISGLPLDPVLPDTPTDEDKLPSRQPADIPICTTVQLLILSVLGDLISYAEEKAGALVQDVVPKPGMEARQENVGSSLLELHTENGFHPTRPDFITLLCLRPDRDDRAQTVVAGMRHALPLVSRDAIEILRQPYFRVAYSSSFVGPGKRVYCDPIPVLSDSGGAESMVVDLHGMEATTVSAQTALTELFDALRQSVVGVRLRPGDLLVVDNRTAVHGRTAFVPRFDGCDRWLRRAFAINDLRRSEAGRPPYSRVIRRSVPPHVSRLSGADTHTREGSRDAAHDESGGPLGEGA